MYRYVRIIFIVKCVTLARFSLHTVMANTQH